MRRSLTSCAIDGCREATTYAYLVVSEVIPLVRNCASTCANQITGSFAQNGGSFTATALTGDTAGSGLEGRGLSAITSRLGHHFGDLMWQVNHPVQGFTVHTETRKLGEKQSCTLLYV